MNPLNKPAITAGIWNVVSSFTLKGANLLFALYFSRVLTVSQYGDISAFSAYSSILTVVIGLNLYSSCNNAKIEYEGQIKSYYSSILTLSSVVFLGLLFVSVIFSKIFSELLLLDRINFILLLIHSFFLYVVMFYQHINIIDFKYKKSAIVSFVNVFGSFALSLLLIKFVMPNNPVTAKYLGSTIPLVLLGSFIIPSVLSKGKKFYSKEFWKYSVLIAAPNILHTLSVDILTQSDRLFIRYLSGAEATGVYGLASLFGMCITLLWNAVNSVWVPWLFLKLRENKTEEILSASKKYLYAFSVITVAACAVIPILIKLFLSDEYRSGIRIITPMILSGYFMCVYSFSANLEFYKKKNRLIALATLFAAVINAALNYIFIKLYGFHAAAYTTLISYIFLFLFHYLAARYLLKFKIYDFKFFLLPVTATCVLSFLV